MASISSAAQSVDVSSKITVVMDPESYYYTRSSNTGTGSVTCSVSLPAGSSISSSAFTCNTSGGTLYGGTTKINNTTITGTGPHTVQTGPVASVTIPLSFKSSYDPSGYTGNPKSSYTQTRTFSNCILTVSYTPPSAPSVSDVRLGNSTGTQYAGAGAGITLSWSAANGTNNAISSYTIQRSTNGGAFSDLATSITAGSYTVYAHASAGQYYQYRVIAIAPYGNSAAMASPLLYTYSAVSIPIGLSISPNKVFPNTSVTLSWSASSGGTGTSVASYNILQNGTVIAGLAGTSYTFAAPTQGSYSYTVQAIANVSGYNSTASAGATLTVDPPASSFELNRATVEMDGTSVITATIDPINSAYNHDVTFSLDATRTSTANVASGSTTRSFTVPLAWCVGVPGATSATASCTVVTKNGTTVIGSLSTSFTVTVPASVMPGAALAVSVVDGFNGLYLKGKSKCRLTSTFTGAQGSTLVSQSLTGGGYSGSSSPFITGVLNAAGTQAMSVTVTDSRSRQKTATQSITVTDYASPSILNVTAYRSDAAGNLLDTGGNIALTASFLVAAIAGNSGTGSIRKRIAGGTWETALAISHNTKVVLTGALPENAYEVEITLIDTVGTASLYSTTIRQAQFAFDFRNDRAALGRLALGEKSFLLPDDWQTNINADKLDDKHASNESGNIPINNGTLNSNLNADKLDGYHFSDILSAIYPIGSLYMSTVNTSPATLFGGTWSSIAAGTFLNAAGSGYAAGGTGGSATHAHTTPDHAHTTAAMTLAESQMPSHAHWQQYAGYNFIDKMGTVLGNGGGGSYTCNRINPGTWSGGNLGLTTQNSGGGGSHGHGNTGNAAPTTNSSSSLPPYLSVYMWKRTA